MKVYELTVERTLEEEQEDEEVITVPRVDNMFQFQGRFLDYPSRSDRCLNGTAATSVQESISMAETKPVLLL